MGWEQHLSVKDVLYEDVDGAHVWHPGSIPVSPTPAAIIAAPTVPVGAVIVAGRITVVPT